MFVQWLDCVWQLTRQFPASFEFGEQFLLAIIDHLRSCRFGNFLYNTEKEREESELRKRTFSLWGHLLHPARVRQFMNPLYALRKLRLEELDEEDARDCAPQQPNAGAGGSGPSVEGKKKDAESPEERAAAGSAAAQRRAAQKQWRHRRVLRARERALLREADGELRPSSSSRCLALWKSCHMRWDFERMRLGSLSMPAVVMETADRLLDAKRAHRRRQMRRGQQVQVEQKAEQE